MAVTLEILMGMFALAMTAAGFFVGRTTSAHAKGAKSATMEADVKYLRQALDDLKEMVKDGQRAHKDDMFALEQRMSEELARCKEEIARERVKLDDHIKSCGK